MSEKKLKNHAINYEKWGYFFIAPFFIIYIIFQLIPLVSTIWNSFFENYRVGLMTVDPNFVGMANYKEVLFNTDMPRYAMNTLIMWIMGFVPQIVLSLLLSIWFCDTELRIKCTSFFKTVIYMPNLIMASAFAMLFFMLFSDAGPVNALAVSMGWIEEPVRFLTQKTTVRTLVAVMNLLMWYGNTTLLLMSGILGIDNSIFEAARIDGANPFTIFVKVTLPSLMPILVYVMITSLIGGIQMFDVPQILTNGGDNPNRTSMTLIMYLNAHLGSKNYGIGGAISVLIFIITAILSATVYKFTMKDYKDAK